jgi:hypothetical protein
MENISAIRLAEEETHSQLDQVSLDNLAPTLEESVLKTYHVVSMVSGETCLRLK